MIYYTQNHQTKEFLMMSKDNLFTDNCNEQRQTKLTNRH